LAVLWLERGGWGGHRVGGVAGGVCRTDDGDRALIKPALQQRAVTAQIGSSRRRVKPPLSGVTGHSRCTDLTAKFDRGCVKTPSFVPRVESPSRFRESKDE